MTVRRSSTLTTFTGRLVSLLGVVLLAACAGGTPVAAPSTAPTSSSTNTQGNTGLQQVIQLAQQEGELDITIASGTLADDLSVYAPSFKKAYGFDLNVKTTPAPNMSALASNMVQEAQAGHKPSTDVFVGFANTFAPLVTNNVAEQDDWSWAPNVQNPAMVAPNGVGVIVQDGLAGITYNTNKLKGDQVPKTLQDLLKPELKGRLASTPSAAAWDYIASDEMWGEQKTFDYLTKLSSQITGLIRCAEVERVASGEFDAFALNCSQNLTLQAKKRGAPLDFSIPTDGATNSVIYASVPKGAAHPNMAKLFINNLVSREGQDVMYASTFADTHFVAGSNTARFMDQVQAGGTKVLSIDLQWVLAQGDKDATRTKRAADILLAGAGKR